MNNSRVYPSKLMETMPTNIELSIATKRLFQKWTATDERYIDLFTHFKYSKISGINHDDGVSRRSPSKIIKVDGLYYVYYSKHDISDRTTAWAEDLGDIYFATSQDGFHWDERGIVLERGALHSVGNRSLTAPDILVWKDRYYLFFQAYQEEGFDHIQKKCGVGMAVAESPQGPFVKQDEFVVKAGEKGAWDSKAIFNPYTIIRDGKLWMYYKGENYAEHGKENSLMPAHGLAVADKPEGPYVKHSLNPVLNSGHEAFFFPYEDGIASIVTFGGVEKNTIQFAEDGVNFDIMSYIHCPPISAGLFSPDVFTDSRDANGVMWGLAQIDRVIEGENSSSILIRFDCDLDRRFWRYEFRNARDFIGRYDEGTFLKENMKLPMEEKERLINSENNKEM